MKQWTDIREWIAEEDRVIAQGFDSITVWTAEEGTGKSYGMLVRQKLADKSFHAKQAWSKGWRPELPTDRVVFEEEDYMRLALSLEPGSALQLDEADAHKRGAMTRQRRKFLKFLKERRSLQIRAAIGFPHVSQIDRDILRTRVRYRAHMPRRGLLEVKSRVLVREDIDRLGNPVPIIRWEYRGRFPIPCLICQAKQCTVAHLPAAEAQRRHLAMKLPALVRDYDSKKAAFSHRDDDLTPLQEPAQPRLLDLEAAGPVLDRIRGLVKR